MKKASAVAVLILIAVFASAQQQSPTVTPQPHTLYVGADGQYEAAPDTALVQFSITAIESKARAAHERAAKAAEQVRNILRSNGIEPKAAEIGYFSVRPIYNYRESKPKLTSYSVSANISIKLKDFSKIAPIVEQLGDVDIAGSQSINYTLENTEAAKTRAVQDAYARAQTEAAALAQAGGRTLGKMLYASIDTYEHVVPVVGGVDRYTTMAPGAARAMAAPVPAEFTPQNVTVTAHVNALFALQ